MGDGQQFDFNLGRPAIPDAIPSFANFGYIPLEHVLNARDLGGMPAADGKHIKTCSLLRSGDLHRATEADLAMLAGTYGLERVIDLRTDDEASANPDRLEDIPNVVFYRDPVFSAEAAGITHGANLFQELRELLETQSGPFDKVQNLYGTMVLGDEGIKAYRMLFEVVLQAEGGSTLWHCTEGKDRTGVGAMLLEYALGVSMENIRSDYLATNVFAREGYERLLDAVGKAGIAKRLDADMDAFMYAYMSYLDHAIDCIQKEYGSIDAYLDKALGVGKDEVAELRRMYLA